MLDTKDDSEAVNHAEGSKWGNGSTQNKWYLVTAGIKIFIL